MQGSNNTFTLHFLFSRYFCLSWMTFRLFPVKLSHRKTYISLQCFFRLVFYFFLHYLLNSPANKNCKEASNGMKNSRELNSEEPRTWLDGRQLGFLRALFQRAVSFLFFLRFFLFFLKEIEIGLMLIILKKIFKHSYQGKLLLY